MPADIGRALEHLVNRLRSFAAHDYDACFMSLLRIFVWLRSIIILAAIVSTTYLYLYPVVLGCAFPSTTASTRDGFKNTVAQHRGQLERNDISLAPFRLLVLADPQLEGDSSLPDPEDALLARIREHSQRVNNASIHDLKDELIAVVRELVFEDIPRSFWAVRKTVDLFGNDYYLAHIYRTLHWWSKPSHVAVLGDLIGSQWVSDDEFDWRGWRYWNRVLAGSHKVDDESMFMHEQEGEQQKMIPLESDDNEWSHKVINIVGNHDIGYAGDISRSRIERFERVFGKVNWDLHFSYPIERLPENYTLSGNEMPSLHLVVLNSMVLDTPALDESVQGATYNYINSLITSRLDPVEARDQTFTLLLTHVPLYKPEGICVDAPFFDFWDHNDDGGVFKKGGLKEQNHLSEHTSHSGVLQGIYGMSGHANANAGGRGRNGLILTGHDHEGCDVVHYIERRRKVRSEEPLVAEPDFDLTDSQLGSEEAPVVTFDNIPPPAWSWKTVRGNDFANTIAGTLTGPDKEDHAVDIATSLREITLRSMMGEYSGNAGLLSLWYDFEASTWTYQMQMCSVGVQHIWWATHIIDLVAALLVVVQVTTWLTGSMKANQRTTKALHKSASANEKPRNTRIEILAGQSSDKDTARGHERSPSQRRRKG